MQRLYFGWAALRLRAPRMTTRRLAAILAADVVGSSRMIEADEDDRSAMRGVAGRRDRASGCASRGRLVKTMGDGFLEFASPVDAVRVRGHLGERCEQRRNGG